MKFVTDTTEQFVKKAQALHNDKYDYSRVKYLGKNSRVVIICPEHGAFEQQARTHMQGKGCMLCGKARMRNNSEDFIAQALSRHGDRYDYSSTVYNLASEKLTIICPTHGPFEQLPSNHLRGTGCKECFAEKRTKTTAEFIAECTAKHNGKYDYSRMRYQNGHSKVIIICPTHGPFEQLALDHAKGFNCAKCSAEAHTQSTEQFIAKARARHGDKYDYSRVVYVHSHSKVTIICPTHGPFEQRPVEHTRNRAAGCRACATGTEKWTVKGWAKRQKSRLARLYIVRIDGHGEVFYKAGITFDSLAKRFQGRTPYAVETLAIFESPDAAVIWTAEANIKKRFRHLKYKPVLRFDGSLECYREPQPLLDFIAATTTLIPK